jgi:Glycosyl hydrolases family 28
MKCPLDFHMNHSFVRIMVLMLAPLASLSANPTDLGTFNVRQHGAVGDGKTLDTAAIQKTIDSATAAGGGIVFFPPGTYLSSSIHLKNQVTLHMEKGATLLGSPQRTGYQKANYHALILADEQAEIGIRGQGTIDGNGKLLAADTARLAREGVLPNADEGQRPCLINFRKCRKVTVRDVTMRDAAMWVQDYRDCEDLLIENITVRSNEVKNNDGIDITGGKRIIVRGCDVDSEDDGICLKSYNTACEDILVENCRVRSSCNAVKFGTGSKVGFKNVTIRNIEIYDTYTSGLALEIVDGGAMEKIHISNIRITDTNNPLFIRLGHRNVDGKAGTLRDVTISDVTAEIPARKPGAKSTYPDHWAHFQNTLMPAMIAGLPGRPIRAVTLRNITFTYGGIGDVALPNHLTYKNLTKVPQQESNYPDANRFGILPAWGLYIRHAEDIHLENVILKFTGTDYRAALLCDDVKNLTLDRFHILSAGEEPVMVLHDVKGAEIRKSPAPPHAIKFIEKLGNTYDINTL